MDKQMLNKPLLIVFLFISAAIIVAPAAGQSAVWRIDSEHSTARLFLTSSRNVAAAANVGVARASGTIEQNAGDSTLSDFDFTIYPADRPETQSGSNRDYTVITFKSTRVFPLGGGAVRVAGNLTLDYVERVVTYNPGEAYSGAVYGPAVHHSVTHEGVFDFDRASPSGTQNAKDDSTEWFASSTTIGEDFPQLLNVVSSTNWPTFVADEQCRVPTVGEDFSGASCTGEIVERAARADLRCEAPLVGEDFAGEVCTETAPVQAANEVQMQLDLHVTRTSAAMAAISGQ
jgi:hypothetical protein